MARKVRVHKNCGGVIHNDKCTKCGKTFGRFTRTFGDYYEEKDEPFDAKNHRRRIKEGRDIWG